MRRTESRPVPSGELRLSVPAEYRAHWLSVPADHALVESWSSASREGSLYNTPAYVRFARRENGRAELLWLSRAGDPVLGIPLHPIGHSRLSTGYSGLMLADGPRDTQRRGVAALLALLALNKRLGFEALQSAQARAYDDPAYVTSLACLFARHGLQGPSLYTRMLDLEPLAAGSTAGPDIHGELLLEHGLGPYQAELRNQVRQAIRGHGLHATCSLPHTEAELRAVYAEFTPLHEESWRRTGMTPHRLEYWTALARAVIEGGGQDMLVCAREADGTALAAVSCHLRGDRALYWAGASSREGLAKRANPLCLHAAIQACRQLGVRHFELGRLNARESSQKELAVTRYKAQFGGELVRIVGFQTRPPDRAVALGALGGARRRARAALSSRPK
jgi:hypothetical protein